MNQGAAQKGPWTDEALPGFVTPTLVSVGVDYRNAIMARASAGGPPGEPTVCLSRLHRIWSELHRQAQAATLAALKAEDDMVGITPPWPREPGRWTDPAWRVELERGDPSRLQAYDDFRAQRGAVELALGLPALRAAEQLLAGLEAEVVDLVRGLLPADLGEAALKYAVLVGHYVDPEGEVQDAKPFVSFLDDLLSMADPLSDLNRPAPDASGAV